MNLLIFGFIAYIIGSIPTAVWIGKSWHGIDIREHGSKNAGATNTFRILGKRAGVIVLVVDIVKGFIAVTLPLCFINFKLFNFLLLSDIDLIVVQIFTAILAVLGHVFPIFAKFKGGKGVATSLGVIIGIHPPAAGICFLLFLIVFIVFNYVSLGAIIASISFPLVLFYLFKETSIWLISFSIALSTAVILAHRKNIIRLINGQENKMKLFK